MLAKPNDGPTREVDVYGPGPYAALAGVVNGVVNGERVNAPASKGDSYLIVQHGRYLCENCSSDGPTGAVGPPKPPRGTVELSVWRPKDRGIDAWGIAATTNVALTRLHPLAVIKFS
jgi:hypothetical protein